MEFRLLGTVSVDTFTGPLPLGPAKRRSLLAALLLSANTPVSVARLTESLWDETPPSQARSVIQGHVSRLRALLTGADAAAYGVELVTLTDAYLLRVPESLLDAQRFEELLMMARQQREPADAAMMLTEALSLWQGPALGGAFTGPPLQAAAHTLEESRLATVEELARTYALLGEHHRAAAVLRPEAVAHPMRESLAAALIKALYGAGRQAEALDWFHRTRRLLADELGIDPGRELADAYALILRGGEVADDPVVPASVPVSAPASAPEVPVATVAVAAEPLVRLPAPAVPVVPPAELLPRAPRGFQGRTEELAALSRAAAGEAPVCLITGPAGVGKTALALQWAHHKASVFPDGRLYADLRGFSETGEPELTDVLREFLPALGVPPRRVPESASAAAALFRTLTERRRLLVVLDNARDSATVRALLPGGPDCVTLVTSRHRLEGLIASDAARPVPLDVLEPQDGMALLAGVLGEERVLAEPVAAQRLAELCGGLPLALRVVAARLAGRPGRPLAALAAELADEQGRLVRLAVDDTGVAAALRLTVQQLPPDAVRLLARLGHHPGSHVDAYACGALLDTGFAAAQATLERLGAAHLVTETAPGRWTLHDLVRLYARDMEPEAGPEALVRALDHLTATALAATDTAEPGGGACFGLPENFHQPRAVREFADRSEALNWFAAERDDLARAVAAARCAGFHDRAWRLVLLHWPQVVLRVRDGWVPLLESALEAARAEQDAYAEARVLSLLGWVLTEEGRTAEAVALLETAPALARKAGDAPGEVTATINLAVARAEHGDLDIALEDCERAAGLARAAGDRHTEMLALQHLARTLLTAGHADRSLDTVRTALALGPEHEETARRALLLTTAGEAHLSLGAHEEGVHLLERAADEAEREGYDEGAARALECLLRVAEKPEYRARYERAVRRLAREA
ncbi:winged helix-turn-helix domain-containing protein [Streptomyces sp. DSM 110735]|uniref:AfsR/SARP family transcriptional regulator n=1 Tax=Streptomyces sp. DSM 110735 TaxID=2775031 RepID=UPI0018F516C5|nr:BTAD domain-containing putative transcriptional regulator [Streptomyces sp. DSM 110735]MBJ7906239.1 winged helix-turn-helix domain-containing protein [Streptomyces sp. DSM 110735]